MSVLTLKDISLTLTGVMFTTGGRVVVVGVVSLSLVVVGVCMADQPS